MEESIKQIKIAFEPILTEVVFKKGEIVHRSNTKSSKIFIVKSGALRSYYLQGGKDITAHFAFKDNIIGAVDSILEQKRSLYSIEALEKSEILLLDYNEMESFLDENPRFERLARQVSQFLYLDLVERLEGMMFLSAKERYEHLLNRYPAIDQQANLGHIASFLGITQETLSRVRKSD